MKKLGSTALLGLSVLGCTTTTPGEQVTQAKPGGKSDSGWLSSNTYEVGALITGSVKTRDADVETDASVQTQLVDEQIKFIKNKAESYGWRFNQLADEVHVTSIEKADDGSLTVAYEAVVDLIGTMEDEDAPSLEEIDPRIFVAKVPLSPNDIGWSSISKCSEGEDGHSASDYNFHYYFTPDKAGCDVPLVEAKIEITNVFERVKAYPEYDQLLRDLGDGRVGFRAALVPNVGDQDRLSRFTAHARMLENTLGLTGVRSSDDKYVRYEWVEGRVAIIIDLYDPTKVDWTSDFYAEFRRRLADYTLIHYNGHSAYGTQHLLDDPESFSDAYQIIMMHSCQSYAYYTRQVFRAKETDEDPTGFALADVVATGMSSYPTGAPRTLGILLRDLQSSMVEIDAGNPENAVDWIQITDEMNAATGEDILYGAAGVRTNRWQPE